MNKIDQQNLHTWHGAEGVTEPPKHAGAHPSNLYAMTHGIWANQCLDDEEQKLFREIIKRLGNDFVFNKSSDFLQVELVGIYSVKLVRAQINGDVEAAEKLDRMIRCHLKDLKATKIAREGESPTGPETTPAEWATALVEKLAGAAGYHAGAGGGPMRAPARCGLARHRRAGTGRSDGGPSRFNGCGMVPRHNRSRG